MENLKMNPKKNIEPPEKVGWKQDEKATAEAQRQEEEKMQIDEAIEILTEWHWLDSKHPWKNMETAIKLGIEALKRVENSRTLNPLLPDEPLLGETKEADNG